MNDNSPEVVMERAWEARIARTKAQLEVVAAAREWRRRYTGGPCIVGSECGHEMCNLARAVDALEELG